MSHEVITARMARQRGLLQLTEAERPSSVIRSAQGTMDWFRWCESEVDRLTAAGRVASLVRHHDGRVSVAVNPLCEGHPDQYYHTRKGEPV